jgi:PIN domain nuclease of toxin-antitoxin system
MTCLLDTHFIVWIVSNSKRLKAHPWLQDHEPWGVSPVSLLEIQLLAEIGKLHIDNPRFTTQLMSDPRFQVDDVPLTSLIQRSLEISWTRDPFDRLIVAHSLVRRVPLCTVDKTLLENHKLVAPELR